MNVNTKEVKGKTVTYLDQEGKEHTLEGDDILICGGHKALREEALSYADAAAEFYPIGDCIGAGNVQVCNRQAYARAMIL